jgi:glyoxylase-like metal-dependent hydrolase (beta-lactamase superfamily II)
MGAAALVKQLADGVQQVSTFPPNAINCYLVQDVLVDAATRLHTRQILGQLERRPPRLHVLTHAHPDHQGASHAVCERFAIPLWCGERDVQAVQSVDGTIGAMGSGPIRAIQKRIAGPPHPVERALVEGDEVAGFTVLEVPGHSVGHVAYFRESDRTLILGDVINNMNVMTGVPGLHEPPKLYTVDPETNRASARKLADLRPSLALFGHGAPLRDPGRFAEFVGRLPQ